MLIRAHKIWCMLLLCIILAQNILLRSMEYCVPRLNILQLKLFQFKSITIWKNPLQSGRIHYSLKNFFIWLTTCSRKWTSEQVWLDKNFVYLIFACGANKAISQCAVTIRDSNTAWCQFNLVTHLRKKIFYLQSQNAILLGN